MKGSSFTHALLVVRRATLSFLFPDGCVACGNPLAHDRRHLCDECRRTVVPAPGTVHLPPGSPIDGVRYALEFDGAARALVRAFKYEGRTSVARELALAALPLAREMAALGIDLIVPVPLHATRRRERGFNQSELLSRELGKALGIESASVLIRTRATASQVGLSAAGRLRNVAGAFEGREELRSTRVLILDDVVTTGSTHAAACEAALRAGAAGVAAIAVAGQVAGPLTSPRRPAPTARGRGRGLIAVTRGAKRVDSQPREA